MIKIDDDELRTINENINIKANSIENSIISNNINNATNIYNEINNKIEENNDILMIDASDLDVSNVNDME